MIDDTDIEHVDCPRGKALDVEELALQLNEQETVHGDGRWHRNRNGAAQEKYFSEFTQVPQVRLDHLVAMPGCRPSATRSSA